MARIVGTSSKKESFGKKKRTSQGGGKLKTSSMNKHKRRNKGI